MRALLAGFKRKTQNFTRGRALVLMFLKLIAMNALMVLATRTIFYYLLDIYEFTDRQRVVAGIVGVQSAGMHVLSEKLRELDADSRVQWLARAQRRVPVSLELRPLAERSDREQAQLRSPRGIWYQYQNSFIDYVGVAYDGTQYLRFGPLAAQSGYFVENETRGWLQLVADLLNSDPLSDRSVKLEELSRMFGIPCTIRYEGTLSAEARQHLRDGSEIAFIGEGDDYYLAQRLNDREEVLWFGPLIKLRTFASGVGTIAILTALLLQSMVVVYYVRDLAFKFQLIEDATEHIAHGDLDVRVKEAQAGELKQLSKAFNRMADRVKSMVDSKRDMLHVVSHELRTPLSRLRFASALLKNSHQDLDWQRNISVIEGSLGDLEQIVNEVIEYVRYQDLEFVRPPTLINIKNALEPILQALAEEAPSLVIETDFACEELEAVVYADRMSLQRVAATLIGNARRYARSTLRVRVYKSRCPSSREKGIGWDVAETTGICMEVEDDGPGIPEGQWTAVIKPFHRLSAALPTSLQGVPNRPEYHAGLGLGLAIVDRIIRQHSGTLEISRGTLGGCLVRTWWPSEENPSG